MDTPETPATPAQPTLEQQIDAAVGKAATLVAPFSAPAAAAIQAGVAVEPILSGLVTMFVGIFHHHMKNPPAAA